MQLGNLFEDRGTALPIRYSSGKKIRDVSIALNWRLIGLLDAGLELFIDGSNMICCMGSFELVFNIYPQNFFFFFLSYQGKFFEEAVAINLQDIEFFLIHISIIDKDWGDLGFLGYGSSLSSEIYSIYLDWIT